MLWEERRLRVFENRVLRRIFRPKRNEITGEWRKLNNEGYIDLYLSPNIEKIEIGGACSTYGESIEVYAGFRWGNLREREHLEDPGVDGRIILRLVFS